MAVCPHSHHVLCDGRHGLHRFDDRKAYDWRWAIMKINPSTHLWAANISMIFVALVTILGELVLPFKDFLKSLTAWGTLPGHHWASKSLLTVLIYVLFLVIFGFMAIDKDNTKIHDNIKITLIVTVLSGLAMFVFYYLHS